MTDRIKEIEARYGPPMINFHMGDDPYLVIKDIRYLIDEVKRLRAVREAAYEFVYDEKFPEKSIADLMANVISALAACEETDEQP